jgi:hypothetical protein
VVVVGGPWLCCVCCRGDEARCSLIKSAASRVGERAVLEECGEEEVVKNTKKKQAKRRRRLKIMV